MNRIFRQAVVAAGLLAAMATAAQVKKDEDGQMIRVLAPELLASILATARSATPCDADDPKPCKIVMKTFKVPGADHKVRYYCVAEVPEVKVKTDASPGLGTKRLIRWKLSADKLNDGTVDKELAFHPEYGIIITKDDDRQIDRRGDLGDGSPGNFDKIRFHTWTRRSVKDAEATYLPVILWGPRGKEEICTAVDPKIVNVQPE